MLPLDNLNLSLMMDIEMDSPMADTPVVKRGSLSPLPSFPKKRAKLNLPQDESMVLNVTLNEMSKYHHWLQLLQEALHDPSRMASLLLVILVHLHMSLTKTSAKANGISSLTFEELESLVEDLDPNERRDLADQIRTCIQSSDWTDLTTHPTLQKPTDTSYIDRASSETTSERAKRLHSMFGRQYQGNFHKLFLRALNDYETIYNPGKHFGRIIPIIQSSCTGKSRMVREIGNYVPTLSICLRGSSLPENGWPPADDPACQFLLRVRPRDERFKGEELAAAFLGAVIAVVAEKLEARGDVAPQKGDWMSDWRLQSATNIAYSRRHTYFTEVAARAENLLLDNCETIVAERMTYESQDGAVDATIDCGSLWHKKLFSMLCDPYFRKLSQILKKWDVKWFLLAIDECSNLNKSYLGRWKVSLFALRRIIKAYDNFVPDVRVWFLLLDTDLSVIDMATLGRESPLDIIEKRFRSLPPWPYVGFNQMGKKNVFKPDKKKLPTDVHCMQHLKFFGRPYWSTLTNDEVLGVAIKKLFSDDGFRPDYAEHVFAAFAVRVGLEIGVGEASKCLAIEAVRNHMHILEAVVGSMVITASPPEPMLALAATMELNCSEKIYKTALETLLDKLILKGVVHDRGLMGELSSRLLLLRARDKSGNGCVAIDQISREPTVQPVALSNFLRTLLGDTLGLADDQCNVREKLLQEASSVWLNFTHIYQMPLSIDEVTESILVNAWSTGAGFQFQHNQPVIDGFLVGYRGSLDEPFRSSNLVTIPWQSKAKSTAAGSVLSHSLTAPFIVPDTESEGQRYWLNIHDHRAENYPVLKGVKKQFDILFMRGLNCPELMPYAEIMAKARSCMILDAEDMDCEISRLLD